MQPIQYAIGKIFQTSDLFENIAMLDITSPVDIAVLNHLFGAIDYVYKRTVRPVAENIAQESGIIAYSMEDSEKYLFILIMLLVFGTICFIRSVVSRIGGKHMIGGSYKNRKKYSAKRRTSVKRKSAKRKSKSAKRKSKTAKRKSKTAKRKSKSTKRKSKTTKRKSKSTKRK
jgi:hypothetical protein